jgi:hypothetical protein
MPVHLVAGDRTSGGSPGCPLLCPLRRFAKVSRDARPAWAVRPLARGGLLRLAPLLSTLLPDGLRFFPRPLPASPSARLTAHVPLRERDGLATVRTSTRGCGRLCLFAGGATSAGDDAGASPPGHFPLGPSLSAPLAWGLSRRLSAVHLPFARASPPCSRPPWGWQSCTPSHESRPPWVVRLHGPKRFLPPRDPGRRSWEGTDGRTAGDVLRLEVITAPRATSCRSPHRPGRAPGTPPVPPPELRLPSHRPLACRSQGWCARSLSPVSRQGRRCPTAPALPWGAWASLPHLPRSSAPRRLPPPRLRALCLSLAPRYLAGFLRSSYP